MFYLGVSAALTAVGAAFFADGTSRAKTRWYIAFAFLVLFVMAALRAPSVGTDLPVYLKQFDRMPEAFPDIFFNTRFEWGYVLYSYWIGFVSRNTVWFTAVTSACILLPIAFLIVRFSRMAWLSVCLFANLLLFAMSLTAIRQYLALAILLCGLPLLERKRPFFYLVVLAASCFHLSALLFLAVPLFYGIRFTRRNVLLLFAAGFVAFFASGVIIDAVGALVPRYALYGTSVYHNGMRPVSFLKAAASGGILLFAWACGYDRRLEREHRSNTELLCAVLAFLIALLEIRATVFDRAEDYFSIFYIVLLPNILTGIRDKYARLAGQWAVAAGSFGYAALILTMRGSWYHISPYTFFFMRTG